MAKKDTYRPLAEVTFRCVLCRRNWKEAPARVEDWGEDELHPWRYFATCAECGLECEQAGFERGLLRAWRSATRPTRSGAACQTESACARTAFVYNSNQGSTAQRQNRRLAEQGLGDENDR